MSIPEKIDFFKDVSTRLGAICGLLFHLAWTSFTVAIGPTVLLIGLIRFPQELWDFVLDWGNNWALILFSPVAGLPVLLVGFGFYYLIFRDFFRCLNRIAGRERRPKEASINRL